MTDGRDIMTRFPVEVSSQILSVLDARSLVACSRVNEGWDEITNNVVPEIWFQACVKAGILVNSDKYDSARDWKAFLSSMMQRKNDMETSACFEIARCRVEKPLTAIFYHKGKIAVAFIGKIEVWEVPGDLLYREFECDFKATFLKFDDNILLSGSSDGLVCLWSMPSGRVLRNYSDIEEIPTSFDFLSDYDIFVNSFLKNRFFVTGVRARSLSHEHLIEKMILQPQSLVVRAMLSPHPDYPLTEKQKKCYLFCLSVDYVCVSVVTLQTHTIFCRILASHKFSKPFDLQVSNDIIYKRPGGLRFHGQNLYIMTPSLPSGNHCILQWDVTTDNPLSMEDNQIVSLLDVGQMYLAYELKTAENAKCIRVFDKISHEIVATVNLPRRFRLRDNFLCLADTSWLDGLNGENDSGIIGAFIAEDRLSVNYIKFLPRRQ